MRFDLKKAVNYKSKCKEQQKSRKGYTSLAATLQPYQCVKVFVELYLKHFIVKVLNATNYF